MKLKLFTNKNETSSSIFCNWCGVSTQDKWDVRQNFNIIHNCIVATPSKYSKYDGRTLELCLCNKHMDELFDFLIEKCRENPIKNKNIKL